MNRPGSPVRTRLCALFGIDLRSLALFRVALGGILLIDLAARARLLATNYTDLGAHPREAVLSYFEAGTLPSLHLLSGSAGVQLALFVAAALAAVLLAVGWHTRVATAVSWFLLTSLHQRNLLVLDGGDHLLRLLLFWSLFLPLGARASLDARRRGAEPAGPVTCSVASAALLLQVGCMFFVTGLLKTGPEWTTDGTAIHYAISHRAWILPFGEWLLAHPPLPQWLTPTVRWFELLGPLALFAPVATAPLRLCAIPGFWGLLAGLGLGLELNLFPWIAGSAMLPFVPALAWDALARRRTPLRIGAATVPAAPAPAWERVARPLSDAAVLALLLLVLWINAGSVDPRLAPPPPFLAPASFLRLEQPWFMYAPSPSRVDVWFVHRGRLRNGAPVDLDRATGGAGWAEVERAWQDYRFLYFLQKLGAPKWQQPLDAYARWLCRRWNLDRSGGARLDSFAIDLVAQPIALPGEPEQPPEVRQVSGGLCPE